VASSVVVVCEVELELVFELVFELEVVDDLGDAAARNCCSVMESGVFESEHACFIVL